MQKYLLRLKNVKQLVCISQTNEEYKIKENMNDVCIIENAFLIVDNQGLIADLGTVEQMDEKYQNCQFDEDIDCTGQSVIPGLVDSHTHPVWSGERIHEFIWKLEGKTYMEIHKQGGGIGYTVDHTRKSSEQELLELLNKRLKRMVHHGTTLVEAKSGYGLNAETEIKMLKVIQQATKMNDIEIVSNYLGAHSIPKGMTEDEATKDIIENQIPLIKEMMDKQEINPELIDVFCEPGVFERENTKKILQAGASIGLKANFHGDEIKPIDSGILGAELGALAISHLENLSSEGILAMAKSKTIGVLLPTTHYLLKLKDPPTREMIDNGVITALASDFNPNMHCLSMPFVMNLACINYKMRPNEALVASTLNSAASINRSKMYGSIEIGKYADLVIINAQRWDHLIYQLVDPPLYKVIKKGKVIFTNDLI